MITNVGSLVTVWLSELIVFPSAPLRDAPLLSGLVLGQLVATPGSPPCSSPFLVFSPGSSVAYSCILASINFADFLVILKVSI